MRPFETLLVVSNLLVWVGLTVHLNSQVRWLKYSVFIALFAMGAQILYEGPRWQMIPAYALTGMFFLIWLLQNFFARSRRDGQRRSSRRAIGLGIGLGILGMIISILPPVLVPVFHFAQPTGPYAIGTLTYHWVDTARPEVFTADPNDHRELMAQVWYPARPEPSAPRAPWVQDASALAPALARLFHFPNFTFGYLKYISTNAVQAAPIADNEPSYPVLIFLHGFTGFRQHNTYQVEELVSHGFIVVGIDQPYAAAAVVFPDGRQANGVPRSRMEALVEQSIRLEEDAPTLNGQVFTDGIIPYFAQDVRFTLSQLEALNQVDPNNILTGRMDLRHTGVFGVSLGGIVGSEACHLDTRLRACLVMDAPMSADVVQDGLTQPGMWITRDAGTMQREGWTPTDIEENQDTMRAAYEHDRAGSYFVQVPGMYHLNLLDFPYLSPLTRWLGMTGPIDAKRAHNIVNAYSLAFFERYLRDRPEPLLDGTSGQYPEVLFTTRRP